MNNYKERILEDLSLIKKSPLFKGLSDSEIKQFINYIDCYYQIYEKGEIIIMTGDSASKFGIILSGQIIYYRDDFWGNRNILLGIKAPNSFGEVFSFTEENRFIMNVIATEKTKILFVDCKQLLMCCNQEESFYQHYILKNMLQVISMKYIDIVQKVEHVMKRSVREKLLSYLSAQAKLAKSSAFEIPFSRQELADYLSVDRSALSAELSKMRRDGILNYQKNQFELFKHNEKELMFE